MVQSSHTFRTVLIDKINKIGYGLDYYYIFLIYFTQHTFLSVLYVKLGTVELNT